MKPLRSTVQAFLASLTFLLALAAAAPRALAEDGSAPVPAPPPADPAKVAAAVEKVERAPADARRLAVEELIRLGPGALDETRKARDRASDPGVRAALERAARWIVAGKLRAVLDERSKSNLTFDGQFADLKSQGPEAAGALLGLFDDEETPASIRISAARALADLADPSVLPRVREIQEDPLLGIGLRKEAGTLMAILGDSSRMEKEIKDLTARAKKKAPALRPGAVDAAALTLNFAKFQANIDLANLYYRIRKYGKAVECYDEAVPILESLRGNERIDKEKLDEQLALTYYNAGCSLTLAGDLDRAKEMLRKSVVIDPVHLKNLDQDGDLKKLRESSGYQEFKRGLEKPLEKKSI
jgi:tetratricopeptide (TPR) repeat protein